MCFLVLKTCSQYQYNRSYNNTLKQERRLDEEAKKVNETGDLKTANQESLLQKIKVKKTLKTTVLTA